MAEMDESDFINYLTESGVLSEWRKAIRGKRPNFFNKGVTTEEVKRWREHLAIPVSDLLCIGFTWSSNSISHLPGSPSWHELSSDWFDMCQGLRRYKTNKTIKIKTR